MVVTDDNSRMRDGSEALRISVECVAISICSPDSLARSPEDLEHLLLKRAVQVGVRLVQEQSVDLGTYYQREHAQPLEETASLNHEVAVAEPGVALGWPELS